MAFWTTDSKNENEMDQPANSSPLSPAMVKSEESCRQPLKASKPSDKQARSALGSGTVIQGKLRFDCLVQIDGTLSGELFSTEQVIVGPTGMIDAQVEVRSIVVYGTVKGSIKALERVELLSGGRIDGEIQCPALSIETGSIFNGSSKMEGAIAGPHKIKAETKIILDEKIPLRPAAVHPVDKPVADGKSKEESRIIISSATNPISRN